MISPSALTNIDKRLSFRVQIKVNCERTPGAELSRKAPFCPSPHFATGNKHYETKDPALKMLPPGERHRGWYQGGVLR